MYPVGGFLLGFVDPNLKPVPVEFDFVNPLVGARRRWSRLGKTRVDEGGKGSALGILAIAHKEQRGIVETLGVDH
jgi:hypothetical protein